MKPYRRSPKGFGYQRIAILPILIGAVLFSSAAVSSPSLSNPFLFASAQTGGVDDDDDDDDNRDRFLIELKSRRFIPGAGLELNNIRGNFSSEDTIHFLVQFEILPNAEERNRIDSLGIHLLAYVTGNTYIASSLVSDLENLARIGNVRWAGPLLADDKISPDLKAGKIGLWAITPDGKIALAVQFHEDVDIVQAIALVQSLGGRYVDSVPRPPQSPPQISLIESVPITEQANVAISGFTLVTAEFDPWAIRRIAQEDLVQYVDIVAPPLTETNDGARAAANVVPLAGAPYGLSGNGVTVLVYDSGLVDTHPDFAGRIIQFDADVTETTRRHSTHVAGTCCGTGINSNGVDSAGNPNGGTPSQWAGMAPAVNIRSFGFSGGGTALYNTGGDLNADFNTALTNGLDLATMSLGNNVVLLNPAPCGQLGDYSGVAVLLDNIVRGTNAGNPSGQQLIYFEAAGNERQGGAPCGNFGTIGSPATAKNTIAVGNINSDTSTIVGSSSLGPTDDGRLKPDITAPGCQAGGDGTITSTRR
jgi:hypothetical protein